MAENKKNDIPDPVSEIIKSPLDSNYTMNRNRVVYLGIAFVVLGLTGGVLDGPFGRVELRPEVWFLASVLGLAASILMMLELRRVAKVSVQFWKRNWEAEYDRFRLYVADALPGFRQTLAQQAQEQKLNDLKKELAEVDENLARRTGGQADASDRSELHEKKSRIDDWINNPANIPIEEKSRYADSAFSKTLNQFSSPSSENWDKGDDEFGYVLNEKNIRYDILVRTEEQFANHSRRYKKAPGRVYLPLWGVAAAILIAWFVFVLGQRPVKESAPTLAQIIREESRMWRTSELFNSRRADGVLVNFWVNNRNDGITMAFPAFAKEEGTLDEALGKPISEFLKPVLSDVTDCNSDTETVKLRIRAFADGASFNTTKSNEQNLSLANKRAESFRSWLGNLPLDNGRKAGAEFEIGVHEWGPEDYPAMRRAAGYNDSLAGAYSERAGQLSRRVELKVSYAAQCEWGRVFGSMVLPN
ncbi:MAG: hypothetical protein K0U72_12100 [Gammaproteobacteria bacterium]|nr:hypothetical protein [Gammaproteobacteria bacterium]